MKTTFSCIILHTNSRVFKTIGCPHGCVGTDSFRGTFGEHLRIQGINCLMRLHKINKPQFRKFTTGQLIKQPLQDIIDFLHALLAFCVDPGLGATSPQGTGKYYKYTNYLYVIVILGYTQGNLFPGSQPW